MRRKIRLIGIVFTWCLFSTVQAQDPYVTISGSAPYVLAPDDQWQGTGQFFVDTADPGTANDECQITGPTFTWTLTPSDESAYINPDTGNSVDLTLAGEDAWGTTYALTVTATWDEEVAEDGDTDIASPRGVFSVSTNTAIFAIKVESIQPDAMANLQEIDDGDGDPKTRIFIVPIAVVTELPATPVTVRAVIEPNLSEEQLPDNFTLQGGTGSAKLTRTISRWPGVSKTEFTFNCGGPDSGFKTTVYVYDAKIGLYADNGGENSPTVGHSWGQYSLDEDTCADMIDSDYWKYCQEIGFFPISTADWGQILLGVSVPGDVRLGSLAVGSHWPTGWGQYPILFSPLQLALPQIDTSYQSPPWYNLFSYNCVDFAIGLGELVDIYTMDMSGVCTPWVFSNWLISNCQSF